MQLARPNAIVSLTAAANLTGCVGRFVTLSSGSVTLISSELDTPFGVLLSDGKAGQKVSVAVAAGGLSGTVRVKLSAAVAAPGTFLQLTATGTVIPSTTTNAARVVCGLALEAGQIGELIEAVMFNPLVIPSKGLLATVTNNTGDFEFLHFVDVYLDWNVVSQTQPIYNATTGIYTLPETGLYWIQLYVVASIEDILSGGVAVLKNGVGIGGASFALLYGDAVIGQGFPFQAQAGDQLRLRSMVNSPENGGGPLQDGSSKIELFKL